jgi:hypothetical protein
MNANSTLTPKIQSGGVTDVARQTRDKNNAKDRNSCVGVAQKWLEARGKV